MEAKQLLSRKKFWIPILSLGLISTALVMTPRTSANHPVYVEGNCDSPVPGTTLVAPGTCGDFDGDGRIGTAEDTDGADRIFGTLNAALGPGTGAAAGTGANFNGRIIIVTSGRFSEVVQNPMITNATLALSGNGHIQIEAAPGVEANIDAVLQGDPAGGNNTRQDAIGILVSMNPGGSVTLRNLTLRNFAVGVRAQGASRLFMENCRLDNNLAAGIHVLGQARATIDGSQISSTGRRIGSANNTTAFGHGVIVEEAGSVLLSRSIITNSLRFGVFNFSSQPSSRFQLILRDNDSGDFSGTPLIAASF